MARLLTLSFICLGFLVGCGSNGTTVTEDFEFAWSGELFRGGDGGSIGATANEEPEANETECEQSSHYCSSVLVTTPSAIEDMFWNAT